MDLSRHQVLVELGLPDDFRGHRERTHIRTWGRRGFLPEERYWLSEISRAGAGSPAIRAMVFYRTQRLLNNKVRYRWSQNRYREEVAKAYERAGVRARRKRESIRHYILDTYYDYLDIYKKKTPGGLEYEYPEKKKTVRKPKGKRIALTTKRRQLRRKIDDLNDQISAASLRGYQEERKRLTRQRNYYQRELDELR